jgi:uncharacterized protein (TIGR03032 family)
VVSFWRDAGAVDPALLRATVRGRWWETLAASGATLLVTREYEHLVLALRAAPRGPRVSHLVLPHPSGVAVDVEHGVVHVAATRNPNQIFDLRPATTDDAGRPLVPVRSRFLPGALYLHDLAIVGGQLHANAVGQNAVIRPGADGGFERAWWPRCIETAAGPAFGPNYLQLNSIAAGATLAQSYFSASTDVMSARRPGHRNFAVDRRGVLFSGATRDVCARGLTRPHSARLWNGRVWVDNSGYGELGVIEDGGFTPVVRLPGWTRGLGFRGGVAFVGTSRVLPRFRHYAPGLDLDRSVCGVHAVDPTSGRVLGSVTWEVGNQIFAVECVPDAMTTGLPFVATRRPGRRETRLFSTFSTGGSGGT